MTPSSISSHDATGAICLRCGAYTDDGSAWCLGCRRESEPSSYRRVYLSEKEAHETSTATMGAQEAAQAVQPEVGRADPESSALAQGRQSGASRPMIADHEFYVDIFDNPATATQCRRIEGMRRCSIPRDQHPVRAETETHCG